MSEKLPPLRPWLIAAWPGMGNVALIAASHLVQQLHMTEIEELPPGPHFDVTDVEVRDGQVLPVRLPRGVFFGWKNPGAGRDLVVFISEAQPSYGSLAYAHALLDVAQRMGIERVATFASLASGLSPSENPKVSGVATDASTLEMLRRAEVPPIAAGQIGGLNGLILGAAADRGIPGMCLMAEIPFFAMRVPNPKAARAALSVFCVLADLDISLEALNRQAEIVDRALIEAMERMAQQAEAGESEESAEPDEGVDEEPELETEPSPAPDAPSREPKLSEADRARVEELFEAARADPSQAVRLKNELDRLGVFKHYEGRFLDLFRKAG